MTRRVLHVVEAYLCGTSTFLTHLPEAQRRSERYDPFMAAESSRYGEELRHLGVDVEEYRFKRQPQAFFAAARQIAAIIERRLLDPIYTHGSFPGLLVRPLLSTVPVIHCAPGWSSVRDDSRWKTFGLLLDAWQSVCPTRIPLHVFGVRDRNDARYVDAPVEGVYHHGWIPHAQLVADLPRFDGIVVPSRSTLLVEAASSRFFETPIQSYRTRFESSA